MDAIIAGYVTLCIGSFLFTFNKKKQLDKIQSTENMSKGTSLVGVQGSGKTFKAIIDCLDLLQRGYRFCWITTQGERQSKIIDYIPTEYRKDVELFAPYKKDSKGFNILKCYTDTENERTLRSQSVVIILDNMSRDLSINMKYCIQLSTQAVLEYQHLTSTPVTLYDAYMMCRREDFKQHIFKSIHKPEWEEDFARFDEPTLSAVVRRFGYILGNSHLKNALCYTKEDALDFQEMFNKVFICDFIEDNIYGLGTLQAIALAQAIMIQFNILASTRHNNSPYYQIVCDEFYRYARGIENIFRDFPDIHRQRVIGLYLIWQRFSQMSKELTDIALSCVNKYFMQLQVEDDAILCRGEMYKAHKGKFSNLKEREYLAFINAGTGISHTTGRTRDIGEPIPTNYSYVLGNCKSKFVKNKFEWWFDNKVIHDGVVDTTKFRSDDF